MTKNYYIKIAGLLSVLILVCSVTAEAQIQAGVNNGVSASWKTVLDTDLVKIIEVHADKWSPRLSKQYVGQAEATKPFLIRVENLASLKAHLQKAIPSATILQEYPAAQALILAISWKEVLTQVLPFPGLVFVDLRDRLPSEERAVPDFDLSVNAVSWLHARYPNLNGEGLGVSVKEYRFDSTDIDFRGRLLSFQRATESMTTHATTMATMIAGAGNSFFTGRGVAWKAALSSSSFFNLMPDPMTYFDASALQIQNHSYGLDIENYYGVEALEYDRQIFENPTLMHIFSAGNRGDSTSVVGPYSGVEGFANLTGTFKMAKNVLTVGSVDSIRTIAPRSSRGPAYDGRVKPELVAFGIDGSSGAAAITSGITTVLQQAYQNEHGGTLPPVEVLRAVLLNSADDLQTPGPDFFSGYGNVNAKAAVETVLENRFRQDRVGAGESKTYLLEIPATARNLKVTLAWIDPPAPINADQALVNDLDLIVAKENTNRPWLPWVLNVFPHPDSLQLPAVRGIDRLNNQEQVTVENPGAGSITITISGHQVQTGAQDFALAFSWETTDDLEWLFPMKNSNLTQGKQTAVRWQSQIATTGILEYSSVGSSDWQVIDANAVLDESYLLWNVPAVTTQAQLRIRTPSATYLSDTFTITEAPQLELAFQCGDSLLLSWNQQPGVDSFQIFYLPDNYMKPLAITTGTNFLLDAKENRSRFYAVAPLITSTQTGLRSSTLNLDFQFPTCYIQRFFATLEGEQAVLQLSVGSLFGIKSIGFEKWNGTRFVPLVTRIPQSRLAEEYTDANLTTGRNFYRAFVELEDGRILLSDVQSVLYTEESYLLFPNPVQSGENLVVVSKEPAQALLHLFDARGKLLGTFNVFTGVDTIPTQKLASGLYFFEITLAGDRQKTGSFVVR